MTDNAFFLIDYINCPLKMQLEIQKIIENREKKLREMLENIQPWNFFGENSDIFCLLIF